MAPSPVFGHDLVFATSGKNGPTLAVRPEPLERGKTDRLTWKQPRGGPYYPSPLVAGDCLYVLLETGLLACRDARTGKLHYRERLADKFTASPVAGDGKVYLINEAGVTTVLRLGAQVRGTGVQ